MEYQPTTTIKTTETRIVATPAEIKAQNEVNLFAEELIKQGSFKAVSAAPGQKVTLQSGESVMTKNSNGKPGFAFNFGGKSKFYPCVESTINSADKSCITGVIISESGIRLLVKFDSIKGQISVSKYSVNPSVNQRSMLKDKYGDSPSRTQPIK
jgi:hypothetical protein